MEYSIMNKNMKHKDLQLSFLSNLTIKEIRVRTLPGIMWKSLLQSQKPILPKSIAFSIFIATVIEIRIKQKTEAISLIFFPANKSMKPNFHVLQDEKIVPVLCRFSV